MRARSLLLASSLALTALPALSAPTVSSVAVQGTEIVVALSDGRVLRSKDLVGAVLDVRFDGQPAKVRVSHVEPDPTERSGTVWLHTFDVQQADGAWRNLCSPGPDGRRQGFPLQGAAQPEFTCTSGAVGKCVRLGYRPWTTGPDGGSLAPYHAACVRMLRGDYGGTGEAWTRDGIRIDAYDRQGIEKADRTFDAAFEAGWSPDGAVCVHHVRVKEGITLAVLEEKYPNLKGRTGELCTEEYARAMGAVIFNRSPP